MRTTRFLPQAVVLAALNALPPNFAVAGPPDRGSTLSAALGGALGDGMSDAGVIGHGRLGPATEARPGRSESFRRQVARDFELEQPGTDPGRSSNELVARSGALPTHASSNSSAGSRRL